MPVLLQEIASSRVKLHDIHAKIRAVGPTDVTSHKDDFFLLLTTAGSIHNALHGIQANLPIIHPSPTAIQQIRLPNLDLKTFDGSLLEWTSFRDIFTASVHNNTTISKGQKLTYLKSLLKGEAAKLIQSMVLSDANYDIAWQHDAMMLFIIITKLDQTSRELLEQTLKGTSIPSLDELFEFMEQRARVLAAGASVRLRPSPHPGSAPSFTPSLWQKGNRKYVSKAFVTTVSMMVISPNPATMLDAAENTDAHGQTQHCRALLDGGSTTCIITTRCTQLLGLKKTRNVAEVVGLSAAPVATAQFATSFVFQPRFSSNNSYSVKALVFPRITEDLPLQQCDTSLWSHLNSITLADPGYYNPCFSNYNNLK
ncbi:hypothetical protein Fcan01_23891 [Folsomia candida]|uniref:Uncharacterized protein n=1 Tax=Folsomia candida TaxID=158441 RepID=A0A226D9K4_FOLCA|nr:hypothetical protein Fcan01_23891 [Folsomia candida]